MWLLVAVAAFSNVRIVAPRVALAQVCVQTRVLPRLDFTWEDACTVWSASPRAAARTVMQAAVLAGDEDRVREAVREGADVNALNAIGYSLFAKLLRYSRIVSTCGLWLLHQRFVFPYFLIWSRFVCVLVYVVKLC